VFTEHLEHPEYPPLTGSLFTGEAEKVCPENNNLL